MSENMGGKGNSHILPLFRFFQAVSPRKEALMGGGTGTGGRVMQFPGPEPRKSFFRPEKLAQFNWSRQVIADRNGAWLASVPELEGCFATGMNIDQALASLDRVLPEWLETALHEGRPIPLPRMV